MGLFRRKSKEKQGTTKRERLKSMEATLRLETILQDEKGFLEFDRFLHSQFAQENLWFWCEVNNFKSTPDHLLQKYAQVIYSTYLAPNAPLWTCLEEKTIADIEDVINKDGEVDATLFDRAQQEVFFTMKMDLLPRFIRAVFNDDDELEEEKAVHGTNEAREPRGRRFSSTPDSRRNLENLWTKQIITSA